MLERVRVRPTDVEAPRSDTHAHMMPHPCGSFPKSMQSKGDPLSPLGPDRYSCTGISSFQTQTPTTVGPPFSRRPLQARASFAGSEQMSAMGRSETLSDDVPHTWAKENLDVGSGFHIGSGGSPRKNNRARRQRGGISGSRSPLGSTEETSGASSEGSATATVSSTTTSAPASSQAAPGGLGASAFMPPPELPPQQQPPPPQQQQPSSSSSAPTASVPSINVSLTQEEFDALGPEERALLQKLSARGLAPSAPQSKRETPRDPVSAPATPQQHKAPGAPPAAAAAAAAFTPPAPPPPPQPPTPADSGAINAGLGHMAGAGFAAAAAMSPESKQQQQQQQDAAAAAAATLPLPHEVTFTVGADGPAPSRRRPGATSKGSSPQSAGASPVSAAAAANAAPRFSPPEVEMKDAEDSLVSFHMGSDAPRSAGGARRRSAGAAAASKPSHATAAEAIKNLEAGVKGLGLDKDAAVAKDGAAADLTVGGGFTIGSAAADGGAAARKPGVARRRRTTCRRRARRVRRRPPRHGAPRAQRTARRRRRPPPLMPAATARPATAGSRRRRHCTPRRRPSSASSGEHRRGSSRRSRRSAATVGTRSSWGEAHACYRKALDELRKHPSHGTDSPDGRALASKAASYHANAAAALMQLGKLQEALSECDAALSADRRLGKALLASRTCS